MEKSDTAVFLRLKTGLDGHDGWTKGQRNLSEQKSVLGVFGGTEESEARRCLLIFTLGQVSGDWGQRADSVRGW